jgi:hypothetical protein
LAIADSFCHVGPSITVPASVIVPLEPETTQVFPESGVVIAPQMPLGGEGFAERAGVDARLAAAPPRAGWCVASFVGATAVLASEAGTLLLLWVWLRLDEPIALLAIAAAAMSAPRSAMKTARFGKTRPARVNACLTTDSPLLRCSKVAAPVFIAFGQLLQGFRGLLLMSSVAICDQYAPLR